MDTLPRKHSPRAVDDREIAIVGIGCRYPEADGLDAFWSILEAGHETISTLTKTELRAAGVSEELISNPHFVPRAAVIDGIELFDPDFFGLSPAEATIMDPQMRIFLECAYDALAQAGMADKAHARSVGVFAGSGTNSYFLNNIITNPDVRATFGDFQTMLANDKDYLATQVSYRFNLTGPSMTVQTACSTSLVAVHLACQSLLEGECDYAMAGGVAISVPQAQGYLYQPGMIMSPDGRCRPFSDQAAGTINGAGAGIVLLQPLDQALAQGAEIHGIIRASAINNDGAEKIGYTAPSVEGQARVITEAQELADVAPHDIGFIETHGTATDLGDRIEVAALRRVWENTNSAHQGKTYLGSVKSNMGHAGAAAGIAGLIKATLAVKAGKIPATLHHDRSHPDLDLEKSPFAVNNELVDWPADHSERIAAVSSFGIGGTNAHVIVAENRFASTQVTPSQEEVPLEQAIWVYGGDTVDAAIDKAHSLARWAKRTHDARPAQVGASLFARQQVWAHRGFAMGKLPADIALALDAPAPFSKNKTTPLKPVFLFSGHGGQAVGMAGELYRHNDVFRACCDRHGAMFVEATGHPLGMFLTKNRDDAAALLEKMQISQPLLYIVQIALSELWGALGVHPAAVAGHSSGEYAAAAVAGVFSVEDGLRLVIARGRLMDQTEPGAMTALNYSPAEIRSILPDGLEISVINGPEMSVVAGPKDRILAFEAMLDTRGVQYHHLQVSLAAHSPTMDPFIDPLTKCATDIAMSPARVRYVSAMLGRDAADEVATAAYWGQHLRQPVRFDQALACLGADAPDNVYLELGPSNALAQILGLNLSGANSVTSLPHPKFETADDMQHYYEAAAKLWAMGGRVDLLPLMRSDGTAPATRLPPERPFKRQRCWIDPKPVVALAPTSSQPDIHARRANLRDWFSVPSWQRAAPFRKVDGYAYRSVIVFNAPGHAVNMIKQALPDASIAWVDNKLPSAGDFDYKALLCDGLPDLILDFTDLGADHSGRLPKAFGHITRLAKALITAHTTCRLIAFTQNLAAVTGTEEIRPEASLLLGPAIVLPQECTDIRISLIDLDPILAGRAQQLDNLPALLGCDLAHGIEAWRGRFRWTQTLTPLPIEAPKSTASPIRKRGVYLFTGGLGNLSMTVIRRLVRDGYAPKLALLTRRAFPAKGDWANAADPLCAELLAFEAAGAEVIVYQGDCSDQGVMADVVARITDQLGPLNGVLHAAGDIGMQIHNGLDEFSFDMALGQLRAKRDGVDVLRDAMVGQDLDFVLLFSSLASVLGGLGFAAYGAANAYLDAMAAQQQQMGQPWLSLNIDAWTADNKDPGEVGANRTFHGIQMSPDEGYQGFLRALTMVDAVQIMMSPSDVLARHKVWVSQQGPVDVVFTDVDSTELVAQTMASIDVAGLTATEAMMAEIWSALLGHTQISPKDNFLAMGGHSLLATRLIAQIKARFDVIYPLRQIFDAPTLGEMAAFVDAARPDLIQNSPVTKQQEDNVTHQGHIWTPLSEAQKQMHFSEGAEQGTGLYLVPMAMRLTGDINPEALRKAFAEMCDRHWIFRACVATVDGEAGLGTHDVQRPELVVHHHADLSLDDLRPQLDASGLKPFDLRRDPLIRAELHCLGAQDYVLQIVQHHLITDGWSTSLMLQELFGLYAGPMLAPAGKDFASHVNWAKQLAKQTDQSKLINYWRDTLSDMPFTHSIPLDHPRKDDRSLVTKNVSHQFDPILVRDLNAWAVDHNASLFMVLLATFNALMYRLTGQDDTAIVTVSASRKETWQEQVIGLLATPIVVRTQLDPQDDFATLVDLVRSNVLSAFDHDALSLHRVVEVVNPPRQAGQHPLSQIGFVVQNFPLNQLGNSERAVQTLPSPALAHEFDMLVSFVSTGDQLAMHVEYATALFEEKRVNDIIVGFDALLTTIMSQPEQRLAALIAPLTTETQALLDWGTPQDKLATDENLPLQAMIKNYVQSQPDFIAIEAADRALTYADLEAEVLAMIAQISDTAPVTLGDRIAVGCTDRTRQVIAFLAVLRIGAVYVPLDPAHPPARHQVVLDDAKPILVVTDGKLESFPNYDDADSLRAQAEGLAYILYTSGTTGKPKGVMIPQSGLSNLAQHLSTRWLSSTGRRVLQLAAPSFDAWVWEVAMAFGAGGTLVLPKQVTQPMGEALATLINDNQISHLTITPPALQVLPRGLYPSLQVVVAAGAALLPDLACQWAQDYDLYNAYGPTETSVCCSMGRVVVDDGPIGIGRTFGDHSLRVLDRDGHPVQSGYVGQLHVGGPGLARGYWRRPDLTQDRFVPNPISGDVHDVLYQTGDLVRVHNDPDIGQFRLSYVARMDHQLKLRGVRVEPDEVVAQLQAFPEVKQAQVFGLPVDAPTYLVAALVPVSGAQIDAADLQAKLAQTLPPLLVPSQIMVVDQLPLSSAGKVDIPALAALWQSIGVARDDSIRSDAEQWVCEAIEEVLEIGSVDLGRNFFDHGGSSLTAVRLAQVLSDRFGWSVPLDHIFSSPSVRVLARIIDPAVEPPTIKADPLPITTGQSGADQHTSFWFPGVEGHTLRLATLAEHASAEGPAYLLPIQVTSDTFQTLLARQVETIRRIQPCGPYRLGGHSLGGTLAYAVAVTMESLGDRVELLTLLDAHAPQMTDDAENTDFIWQVVSWVLAQNGIEIPLEDMPIAEDKPSIDAVLAALHHHPAYTSHAAGLTPMLQAALRYYRLVSERAFWSRQTGKTDIPTLIFRALLSDEQTEPDLGWGKFVKQPDTHDVDCDHNGLLQDPPAAAIATTWSAFLQK